MNISLIIFLVIAAWALFSIYYITKLVRSKQTKAINLYIYNSIPPVFTTLGVLGTFLGIFVGLQDFDVDAIDTSIPNLLEGMKTAFLTSIIGIIFSLLFGKATKIAFSWVEKNNPESKPGELGELHRIVNLMHEFKDQSERHKTKLLDAIGRGKENSLQTQMLQLRNDQIEIARKAQKDIEDVASVLKRNHEKVQEKFDEFAQMLARSNTDALLEVMKQATEEFNVQMKELINKLVKENFEELNQSVERMNQWQIENKEMISTLTEQFQGVAQNLNSSSEAIEKITSNTHKLTDENSHLTKLIGALQEVMIEDTKYQEIAGNITTTVETLKSNTESFDATTDKLNDWVKNQMNFNDSVAKLLTRLEEIDKIKDINEVFWNDTKKQLNEGVSIIRQSSESLNGDLDTINAQFYERLNDTLNSLDTLIQRIIENYKP